jgi:hypothetical protein
VHAQQSQSGLGIGLGACTFLNQAIVEVAMAAGAGFRGAHPLLLQHKCDAANHHGLADRQRDALPGWNARGAHMGAIGAAEILDLDSRADVQRGMLTRRARVRNANIGVVIATDR